MFTNEYISLEDIDKFRLNELINKYNNSNHNSYEQYWTINKKTNTWLIPVKQVNSSEAIWILHYKNINIEIKLYKTEDGWDLTSIAPNSLNNQEIIECIQEALEVLDTINIRWATPKEIDLKKEIKKTIKKKEKRKITYLDIVVLIIVLVILFFIANDSNNIAPIVENDYNKTSPKTQTIKSEYNICVAKYNGIFLTNSKDLNTQIKVVDIPNKQLITCNVDKYGNLYWVDRTNEGLYKADLDGTNARKIVTLPVLASGLAIDNEGERLFSAQWNIKRKHHEIVYSDLSGNNKIILLSDRELLRSVSGMSYNYVNDKLYVSDMTKKQIVAIDLKTKELKKVVDSNRPEEVIVDYKNEKIIWVDSNVYSVNFDGSDKKILIPSNGEKRHFGTLTIDTTNNRLIFGYLLSVSDANNNQNNKHIIETSNLDGTQRTKIKSKPFTSFSFFNDNLIVSKKAETNQKEIVKSQDKLAITQELKKCLACHGKDWSKSALGKSAIVKNMSKENIAKALKGYKDGTYGGPMKGLMKGQVSKYSDKELEVMSEIIKL